MNGYLGLVRWRQFYKNLLIFLPVIFAAEFFNFDYLLTVCLGFLVLCLVSSANYIINDVADRERDKAHPEKKLRPIASGRVKVWHALLLSFVLVLASFVAAFMLSRNFFYSVLFLFLFTQVYTFVLKKEVFADVLAIAINFVVRAVSGALIIDVRISPWLILCAFFLSLFLSSGKREADSALLKGKAGLHKEVLLYYTPKITSLMMSFSTTALVVSYSLYSFLSIYPYLIFSLPFALYVVFRYVYFVYSGNVIARHPERVFSDPKMIIGIMIWLLISFLVVY